MRSNKKLKELMKKTLGGNMEWVSLFGSRHTLCYVVHYDGGVYLHSYVLVGASVIKLKAK